MNKCSVLIVDDNMLLRMGLTEAISGEPDMEVAGEASNGVDAYSQYATLRPDVVIMDYRMPKENGVEATRKIKADFPDAKIILLSVYEGEEDVWNAWSAGVAGYLSKSEAAHNIVSAIRQVALGAFVFPEAISQKLDARKNRTSLSPRELEVLGLIVGGLSNKEMETQLSLSTGTVKFHVHNLLEKLQVADRTQAVVVAVKNGIIHLK